MSGLHEVTSLSDYESFIGRNKVVLFFGSRGCGHCDDMAPVVEELIKNYPNVNFAHIELNKHYRRVVSENVNVFPMFVAYRKSVYVAHFAGADPERLTKLVQSL